MVTPDGSERGFFVYLGPSIHGEIVIQTASLYAGTRQDVEARLAREIAKYPRIKRLLVSHRTIATDRIKVKTPGNYLYNEYKMMVADVKNKKEE